MARARKAVVVTTVHRGVFFGYLHSKDGDTVVLTQARNCLYWHKSVHGFLGLAKDGPNAECRVGPAVDRLDVYGVSTIANCTAKAISAWQGEPWS